MFNFKKISAVLTSVVMLGSSIGIAAAANYPAPFISGGVANVAVVYGTGTGVSVLDAVQAGNIQSNLQSRMGSGGTSLTTTCSGGDCYLFELASTKLNMNDTLRSIKDSDLDDSEMPNILAGLDYKAGDGKTYGYTQKINMTGSSTSGLLFESFQDSDFNDDKPSLGIKIKDGNPILQYKVAWTKNPESDVDSAGRLEDLENSKINLLGKEFTILNAYNESVNGKVQLELMGGAIVSSVNRDESITHTLNGKSYIIRPSYIASTKTTLCISIDGGAEECESELEKGETFELSDETQVGIRAINYAAKSGTIDSVDFSLGAEKLELKNASNVEINDEEISDFTVILDRVPVAGSKEKLSDITFVWTANDDLFISGDGEITMPGLGGIKLASKGFYVPVEETIVVDAASSTRFELEIPIESGKANIPILYGNESTWTNVGKDTDDHLLTGNSSSVLDDTPNVLFNYTTCGTNHQRSSCDHKWFVATWNSSTDSMSYFLSLSSITESSGENYTTVKDEVTGSSICTDVKNGDTCTIGNIVLTFGDIQKKSKTVMMTLNSGGSFNRIYSKEGMEFYLPVVINYTDTTPAEAAAYGWSGIAQNGTADNIEFTMKSFEEDKNGNLGIGQDINYTLSWSSQKVRVSKVHALWAGKTARTANPALETDPNADSNEFVEWVKSDLATKVLHKRPTGSDSQYEVEVTYHGDETYGLVYLAGENADISASGGTTTTTTVTQLGDVVVKDTEVSSVSSKNLIIVGGSCINSAAAKVIGSAACGAAFTEATGVGSGQFLIESVGDVYATGKIALVVAGYDAADTQNAAKYLTTQTVDTTAGKKYKGTSATTAELVVAAA